MALKLGLSKLTVSSLLIGYERKILSPHWLILTIRSTLLKLWFTSSQPTSPFTKIPFFPSTQYSFICSNSWNWYLTGARHTMTQLVSQRDSGRHRENNQSRILAHYALVNNFNLTLFFVNSWHFPPSASLEHLKHARGEDCKNNLMFARCKSFFTRIWQERRRGGGGLIKTS